MVWNYENWKDKSKRIISFQFIDCWYDSFSFKNSYLLRQKYYLFKNGASTVARSRDKL